MGKELCPWAFLWSGRFWKDIPTLKTPDHAGRSCLLRHVIGEHTTMETGTRRARVKALCGWL